MGQWSVVIWRKDFGMGVDTALQTLPESRRQRHNLAVRAQTPAKEEWTGERAPSLRQEQRFRRAFH